MKRPGNKARAFLQSTATAALHCHPPDEPAATATMHCHPLGDTQPPPLVPHAQNLSSNRIAPTDNMRPNFDDDYSRHGKLRVNFSVYIPWMVQISIRYQLRRKTFETGGGTDSCACISTHMLGGSGGMFPQEKFY